MRRTEASIKRFVNERFVTCKYCGYNNKKRRLENYGTCLRCRKIIDEKSYLRRKLGGNLVWQKRKKSN